MKKIYITGIAGLLGNTIAQELKSKYQICGADAVKVNMEAVSYDCIDLTNYELLEKSIVSSHPDVVVHTVAVVNVDLCETDKELAKKIKRPKNMGMSNEKIKRELGITIRNAYESLDYFYELCIQRGIVSND